MSNTVIKVENLSKQYRLGQVGTGTLSHDLNRWWHRVRGKEDPYLKIGEVNDRANKGDSEYVWALQDINFEVKQGEVLGIIGKNGAGKSTLLKILSKVTGPTTGSIKAKGRIASLLEVGTGFHQELTGRENIFLNGTILGMTRAEVNKKLDEIVDFAGVERFLDTPVKRYSSGMMVRLGFAVAAHLEPEILIVDEVLAVGDVEFQKKAVGKMQEVSSQGGRTVLFVSHNMESVKSLCKDGLLLEHGRVSLIADAEEVVNTYLRTKSTLANYQKGWPLDLAPGNNFAKVVAYKISNYENDSFNIHIHDSIIIDFKYWLGYETSNRIDVALHIFDQNQKLVGALATTLSKEYKIKQIYSKGVHNISFIIPNCQLNEGIYSITFRIIENRANRAIIRIDELITFEIKTLAGANEYLKTPGQIRLLFHTSDQVSI